MLHIIHVYNVVKFIYVSIFCFIIHYSDVYILVILYIVSTIRW